MMVSVNEYGSMIESIINTRNGAHDHISNACAPPFQIMNAKYIWYAYARMYLIVKYEPT